MNILPCSAPVQRLALLAVCSLGASFPAAAQVTITQGQEQVSVEIDGNPFTVFHIAGEHLNRVYLHPLRAASGTIVNRSFPAGQLPGESVDHPHHAGLFYGHGDVNGFNFWAIQNVPTPAAPARAPSESPAGIPKATAPALTASTRGRIVPKGPVTVTSGQATGTIDAVLTWLKPDGQPLLTETRRMTFHAHPELRIVDVDIDLLAIERAEFRDTKEGTFAMRVASALDEQVPAGRQGASPTRGKLMNAQGGEGESNVWGKRSEWVDYSGRIGGEAVGIVMMDHPENPRHPTYWHSRGYGLHAINPFGVSDFLNDKTQNGSLTIEPGEHVRFRYRVVIHPGASRARLAELYKEYAQTKGSSSGE